MIKFTYEQLSVERMRQSSGLFIGKTNVLKNFSKESEINEVVGRISGEKNKVHANIWIKNKDKWGGF
jgi:hypothetical protein